MKLRHWLWKETKPPRLSLQRHSLSGRRGRLNKKSNLSLRASSICSVNFSSTRSGHPGFPVFAALRSEVDAKDYVKDRPGLQDNAA